MIICITLTITGEQGMIPFQKHVNAKPRMGYSGPTLRIQCMVLLCGIPVFLNSYYKGLFQVMMSHP